MRDGWREQHRRWHAEQHARRRRGWVAGRMPWFVHWQLRRRIFGAFATAVVVGAAVGWGLYRHGVAPAWALAAMVAVLWAAAGALAWRLSIPLVEMARVASRLGDGELGARMHVPRVPGRELTAIAIAVNEMAARIEKQLRDQRELLAAVSHEIRTPLGHLRILLDTARDRGLPEDVLAELEREVLEVDALADQLLASSRLDFGTLERRELDVAVEAARALERLGVDASVLDVEADRCVVSADPTLLRGALANLVRNAVEHGGGVARLAVRRADGAVEVEVDDDGPGFAPDDLPRAFEPFHRRAGGGGSLGLGLALVDRIARAHQGTATATNRPGGGARVTLRLPSLPD